MMRLLVLRPEPGAGATAAKARELGFHPECVPLFQIEALDWTAPEPARFDGLLFTSANAVRCAGTELLRYRGLKVYAVGEATAEAARDAGFDVASTGDSGVDRLLGSIEPDLKLLHLCGEDRRDTDKVRQSITFVPVYRAKEVPDPDLSRASSSVALIHSPRAGRRFAQLMSERRRTIIAAISNVAADAAGPGWRSVGVADQPNESALLALAARLCKNAQPE
ncbi:MAG TPA: uroporphyrinogen-III synthase [Sphingomicrobium sp.]|nr:uroporphyrinogen-III synthase [Sphingomicrobium sp.]